ncbi:MAG: hypothetical protein ABL890_00195 [Candidatus Peribacteraceae bacterium]
MRSSTHSSPSLSDLFSQIGALLLRSWSAVLLSALCFALFSAVLSTVPDRWMQAREDKLAASMNLRWDELRARVEADMQELLAVPTEVIVKEMQSMSMFPAPDASSHISLVYFMNVGPYIFVGILIGLSILFLSVSYYFLLFASSTPSSLHALRRMPVFIVRFLTLTLMQMAASLIWVPFVGIGLAAYMLPRFAFAPARLAIGKVHSFTAMKESWMLTRGRWLRILVRLILLCLVGFMLLWLCSIPVSAAVLFQPKLGALLWMISLTLFTAYMAAGMTVLAR